MISLRANALAASFEQVIVGLTFFIFYGALMRMAGAELVGVLSLVLVLASLASMTSAGFATALAHFVPLFEGEQNRKLTIECIDTTLICTAILYLSILGISYYPFALMISTQAGPEHKELVHQLMIPATLHVFISGVGSTTNLTLTSLQRSDLRLWAALVSAVAGLAVLFISVPRIGIVGGLWALAIQSAVNAIVTWIQIARRLPELGPIPHRFSISMVKRIFSLGVNMQVQTLLVASVEPITRLLIGSYGSLPTVAYFAMASRYVLQTRALIYAGAQPLLSAFSQARAVDVAEFTKLYRRAAMVVGAIASITLSASTGAAPFIGELWIGEMQLDFVLFAALLAGGWLVNTMTMASYFNAYSLGFMIPSLIGHILLFIVNIAIGYPLSREFGSVGAVLGMSLALFIFGAYLAMANSRHAPARPEPSELRSIAIQGVCGFVAAGAAIASYLYFRQSNSVLLSGVASGLTWLMIIGPSALSHPAVRAFLIARRRKGELRTEE